MDRIEGLAPPLRALARVGVALLLVGLVSAVLAMFSRFVEVAGLAVLYIAAVLVSALVAGRGAAVVAAVGAFLAFDLLFVEPRLTLTVAEPAEWLTLLVLLVTGLVTGQLAALVRQRTREAQANERAASVLYAVAHAIATRPFEEAMQAITTTLLEAVGASAVRIDTPMHSVSSGSDAARRQLQDTGSVGEARILGASGEGADGFGRRRWIATRTGLRRRGPTAFDVYRVRIAAEADAYIAIAVPNGSRDLDAVSQRLLVTSAEEIGEALERRRLRREAMEVEALRRADELRAMLLNTVSHDLRTPLAAIVAAADSLRSDIAWSDVERAEFLDDIADEARRLDRMVRHLLDLSRIESGSLRLALDWYDPADVVGETVGRLRESLPGRQIRLHVPAEVASVLLDPVAVGEVVANLVENACRHTPAETPVDVSVQDCPDVLTIVVSDGGPGIPADVLPHLFEPFARARGLRDRRGTGLGLAVAKALVEALGGTLTASNRLEGGARFVVALPRTAAPTPPAPGGTA
ncbi:MAG: ATP-binding protein [Dehalococcoidia bacterium]